MNSGGFSEAGCDIRAKVCRFLSSSLTPGAVLLLAKLLGGGVAFEE